MYTFKCGYLFIAWVFAYMCIAYLNNKVILDDSFYYSAFGNQLSKERIDNIIEMNKKISSIVYAATPFLLLLKWSIVAGIIYVGIFLFNQNLVFKYCFRIVILAELMPIAVALVKLAYFFIYPPSNLQDVQRFYPLSLMAFFTNKQLPSYLIYPLQQFNVFEIIYWLFIASGIKAFTQKSFGYSFKIVASSYGVVLGVWILAIMFIQLQFSA